MLMLFFYFRYFNTIKEIKMNSIFIKSEPEWEIDPVDDVFSEEAIKVSSNVVNNWSLGMVNCLPNFFKILFTH